MTLGSGPLPHSEDAEISVLGAPFAALDDGGETTGRLVEMVEEEDFFLARHRALFRAIQRIHDRGEPVDVLTVSEALIDAGELEDAGGMSYLAQLVDAVPTAANLEAYVEVLREYRRRRKIAEAAEEALEAAHGRNGTKPPVKIAAALRDRIEAVRRLEPDKADRLRTAREILDDPDARRTPATVVEKLAWAGRVTLLAGREKSGKSTLVRWATARRAAGERVWGGPPTGDGCEVLYYGQEPRVDIAVDLDRFGANLDRVHVADMRTFADRLGHLERDIKTIQPGLVVVDTLSTLTALMDLDPGSAADWEPVMDQLGALASKSDAAFALNHHARKSDGEYRDSTAIGAGVDAILELRPSPSEEENVRSVTARARSAIPAANFEYSLTGDGPYARLELLDGSLSLEERVQRFVADHEGCSQRAVLDGVRGQRDDVRDALKRLAQSGGPVVEDDSSTPYQYRIAETARRNATGTVEERKRNGGIDSGGRSVPLATGAPVRGPVRGTQAGSVDDENDSENDDTGNRCANCHRPIGLTSKVCGACKTTDREEATS